jgi:hypothetical protein
MIHTLIIVYISTIGITQVGVQFHDFATIEKCLAASAYMYKEVKDDSAVIIHTRCVPK